MGQLAEAMDEGAELDDSDPQPIELNTFRDVKTDFCDKNRSKGVQMPICILLNNKSSENLELSHSPHHLREGSKEGRK
jgi:hypothetical protein